MFGWCYEFGDGEKRMSQGLRVNVKRKQQSVNGKDARVTTADAEQTTVAAFRPWRGS
jgi:hypothetical protein